MYMYMLALPWPSFVHMAPLCFFIPPRRPAYLCAMLVPHSRLLSLYCTALVHANGNVPDVYSVYHPQHDLSKASRCFCHYMRLPDAFEMVSSRTVTQRAGIKSP